MQTKLDKAFKIIVDISNRKVTIPQAISWYVTDENIAHLNCQIIDEVEDSIIDIQSYKLSMRVLSPSRILKEVNYTLNDAANNIFTLTLPDELITEKGRHQCELSIEYLGDKLTSEPFNYNIIQSIANQLDSTISKDSHYPLVLELEDKLKEWNNILDEQVSKVIILNNDVTNAEKTRQANEAQRIADEAIRAEFYDSFSSQLADNTHYVNVRKYEHLVDGDDWTLALQTAINENSKVIISNSIKIYGTVTLHTGKVIEIGACTVSKPSDATDNGPIFWLRGNQNTLRGQGQGSSAITMGVSSPEGAVRIGHSTDTKADTNCLYNQVCDVQINGGSRDDGVSVALMMRNAETDGLASYFHTISNVRITRAHMGIVLKGYMNANLMNNIQLYQAGGNQTGGAICFLGIGSKVPMENSINGVFHHASAHACTLLIDCATFYNKVTNILSEQGGTNARCLKVTENGVNAFSNTFTTSPNVNYANIVDSSFTKRNIIEGFNSTQIGTVTSNTMRTTNLTAKSFNMNDIKTQKMYKSNQSIAENEKVTLLTVGVMGETNLQTCLGTIKMVMRSSTNVSAFMQVAEQKFKLYEGVDTLAVTVLSEIGHKLTWTDGTLSVKTFNNGTNTKNFTIWFELELFGYQWSNLTIGEKFSEM